MSDFSVTVGGDFSELLQGLKQLPAEAQRAGYAIGEGLDTGIKEADRSVGQLLGQIKALRATQAKLSVDSAEYQKAQTEIKAIGLLIGELQRKKLTLNADATSINSLNAKLGELQAELGRVAIGSQRFRELQTAIQSTERELAKAGQSADGFNLIDGAIQGLAFSLTNTVTNAAGSALRAIGGLISGFAELDTEIRQAAAASGETGAYDKISRTIDQVGIEASGSTIEVAKLATELVRGGMSVDQVNDSLGVIVRGAEATGTGFASMGSVVSATLKGFGLQATDATRVVDALVTGANASATSVEGMGMAFKYAAPVAKILGVSVEDLGLTVGLMTNAGIEASEAGVTLRNGLSQLAIAAPKAGGGVSGLTGQAKKAAEEMKRLGLNIYNTDGTLKPMQETLLTLKSAFDKLDPASKLNLASNLFGGTDDGAKWLSLLGQSREEIIKMATTMANTKGATDTARDAMQGFQMSTKQLGGTLDSLGITLGGVAATALKPLIDIANTAIGAIAGLPAPIKIAGAALTLLAGAAATATAAMVIFQRAMEVTAVQTAGNEILQLARNFGTTFKGAIDAASASIPALITGLQRIAEANVGQSVDMLVRDLGSNFVMAVKSARFEYEKFIFSLNEGKFSGAIANIKAAAVPLGALALAVIGVSAAVASYNASTADSQKIAEAAADGQNKLTASLTAAGLKTGELTTLGGPFARAWQNAGAAVSNFLGFLNQIPVIGGLVAGALKPLVDAVGSLANAIKKYWQDANDTQGLEQAAVALNNLGMQAGVAENAAARLYAELKASGGPPNTQQTEQINKVGQALIAAREQARTLQKQYTLLAEAARNSGNEQLAKEYEILAGSAGKAADYSGFQLNQLNSLLPANEKVTQAVSEQSEATKELIKVTAEITKLRQEAPVRDLEARIAVGQQLLGLTKSIGDLEQSRFSVAKAGLQFELKALQDRGASESTIAAKKAEIDQADRAALSARYQALTQQQALEQEMLRLSQEKARAEANLDVKRQQIKLLEEEINLRNLGKNASQEDRDLAQAKINLQKEILGISQEQVGILDKTQPLERASAAATAEIARNGLQAEARAKGYSIAVDGSLVKTRGLATSLQSVAVFSGKSADEQDRYRQIAEQSGLAIGRAADGSVVLGRTQQEVNQAVADMNSELVNANVKVGDLSEGLKEGAGGAISAKDATDGLSESLLAGKAPAGDIANAFASIGGKSPEVVQSARNFAGWLSSAKTFAETIANLDLGKKMTDVSNATKEAARQAESFYGWLLKASGLPGSRWSGGPVDAGEAYKVNELGQEALLAGGRLSLIQAPANSIWRAPSSGVVIPAGITARLQDAGALPSPGGIAAVGGNAELAIEIGKLRQEVGELARKQWNINVTQRTGPTGSQVLRTLQQLR